jgi:ankyrin repeat protein
MHAARKGHLAALQALLASGVDIHKVDKVGRNALAHAAYGGSEEAVNVLVLLGAEMDRPFKDGWNLLLSAALRSQESIVNRLLDAGVDVNVRGPEGRTALMHSIAGDASDCLINRMLDAKATVNVRDVYGCTPLLLAINKRQSKDEIFDRLVQDAETTAAKDALGRGALHHTCSVGTIDIAHYLIKNRADIDSVDDEGCTPLMCAAQAGHSRMVRL